WTLAAALFGATACVDPNPPKPAPRPTAILRPPRAAVPRTLGTMTPIDAPTEGLAPQHAGEAGAVRQVIGASVQGRPLETIVYGDGGDCVFILATIHGDEDAGTPLLEKLEDHLNARPDLARGRRIVLMPLANPDGMAEQTRGNSNGIDLNRNYPADNFRANARHGDTALSEPESRAIYEVIDRYRP